jgi:transcriptional regulator with XRE-family HTH domain
MLKEETESNIFPELVKLKRFPRFSSRVLTWRLERVIRPLFYPKIILIPKKLLDIRSLFYYIEHHGTWSNSAMKPFGEILRDIRIEAGLGLRELARLVDKSQGYLSNIENGRVAPPSEEVIMDMARALKVEPQRLLVAARKVDPELSDYVADMPVAADFLRTAIDEEYDEEDFARLTQLAKIAKLGKGDGET